ncbi:MAG: asparagine--tRNA ligase [Aigarchaeota archaeon]|nr:asparagine--tRNA ligase [Candidatus Wolframiiraptor gerlachensis]
MLKKLYVEDVKKLPEGSEATLLGWVRSKRSHGGLLFIDLRDSTGIIQVTIRKGEVPDDSFEHAARLRRESAIKVSGVVRHDPRAPDGVELRCRSIDVIGESLDDFPIRKGIKIKFLLDNRHLHIRSPRVTAIMKIRAELLKAARRWFEENGFIEINCPSFITAAVEGGATLFKLDYFGREAYLTQSSQFYQEAAIYSLEKVYSIQPSFRAELSRTRRHLTEFWHLEAEIAYAELEDLLEVIENLFYAMVKGVCEQAEKELSLLGVKLDPDVAKPPYPRITYAEALEILRRKGFDVKWGDDFGADEERELSKEFDKPFFVTHWARESKAFYHMPDPADPRVCRNADLLTPGGYGEVVGGGQRIHDYNQLIERIREAGLNPEDYKWYLDLRKYGSVPHSGFGLGIERMLWWMLRLPHIRDACLFPRTPARVYP